MDVCIFRRVEKKYLLLPEQFWALMKKQRINLLSDALIPKKQFFAKFYSSEKAVTPSENTGAKASKSATSFFNVSCIYYVIL